MNVAPELLSAQSSHRQNEPSIAAHQIVLALAMVLTFVAYCGSIGYEFVSDDKAFIVGDRLVQSWRFVLRYFTQETFQAVNGTGVPGNYYRPLFLLWLRINHQIFGLKPWGFHLTNILVHLGVTLAVYFLAVRILGDRLTAAFSALIFGLHPVHVEAVVWICGVTETLLALLFVLSFLCYLRSRDDPGRRRVWLAAAILLYVGAMLTKETAVVFPALVFAYEWIFWRPGAGVTPWRGRFERTRRALGSAGWFLPVVLFYFVARTLALKGLVHPNQPLSLSTVLLTWPLVLFFSCKLLLWPLGLSPFYKTSGVTAAISLDFTLRVMGLASIAVLLWAWARRAETRELDSSRRSKSKVIAFAAAWVFLTTLPVLAFALIPGDALAHDRLMYLPSLGLAMLAALALRSLKIGSGKRHGATAIQIGLVAAMAIVFAFRTISQSVIWADDLLFYSQGLKELPNDNLLKTNLAQAMAERGHNPGAIKLYQEVLSRDPHDPLATYNLGFLLYRLKKLDEAEKYLRQAVAVSPDSPQANLLFGLTQFRRGRLDEAAVLLHRAERLDPEAYGVHFARGMVLKLEGDLPGAIEEFKAELALNPEQDAARDQISEIESRLHRP